MKLNNYYIPSYTKNYKLLEQNYRKQRQAELEKAFQVPEYWQILNRAEEGKKNSGRVLRLKTEGKSKEIAVSIKTEIKTPQGLDPITAYRIYDGPIEAGYVSIKELPDGAYIAMIENKKQEVYGGVEKLAQRIAVANCLKRGLKNFNITGDAVWESHAIHYIAGMRFDYMYNANRARTAKRLFGTDNVNTIVKNIIKNTPKGGKYYTSILGCVRMHMLKSVIKNITAYLKKHPVLL